MCFYLYSKPYVNNVLFKACCCIGYIHHVFDLIYLFQVQIYTSFCMYSVLIDNCAVFTTFSSIFDEV